MFKSPFEIIAYWLMTENQVKVNRNMKISYFFKTKCVWVISIFFLIFNFFNKIIILPWLDIMMQIEPSSISMSGIRPKIGTGWGGPFGHVSGSKSATN